jgi:hypothetical protein
MIPSWWGSAVAQEETVKPSSEFTGPYGLISWTERAVGVVRMAIPRLLKAANARRPSDGAVSVIDVAS